MKYGVIIIAGMFLLSAYITTRNDFKRLYALEGTWRMKTKRGLLCEEWKKINDDHLQSRGYIIRNNDTIINERVALTRQGDDIFYTSTVENQNNKQPVAFKMTKQQGNSFIFENPQHDFPKRIVYELVNTDSLHAFIDDGIDDTGHIQHFYYKRFH
ncbi:DUF6265 family protein [Ferruginibacter sp.]